METPVFRIQPWDPDTGLEHIATTWIFSKDKAGNDVIAEKYYTKEDNPSGLTSFKLNYSIPNGVVYYIKACYHLKDSEDNVNVVCIDPVPVINNESSLNEVLIPELNINTPGIESYQFDPDNGLTIKLAEKVATVPINEIYIEFRTLNDKYLYVKKVDGQESTITISVDEMNFTQYDKLKVNILYKSNLGIVSLPGRYTLSYAEGLFTLVGPLNTLSTSIDNRITVVPNDLNIHLVSARLYDINNTYIGNCIINDWTIIIPHELLRPQQTYKLGVTVTYTDTDNNVLTKELIYLVNTVSQEEGYRLLDIEMSDEITKIKEDQAGIFNTGYIHFTENNRNGLIPIIDTDGNINLFVFRDGELVKVKQAGTITLDNSFDRLKLEFVPYDYFNVFTSLADDNDKLYIDIYKYDYYANTVTYINRVEHTGTNIRQALLTNSIILFKNKWYVFRTVGNSLIIRIIDPITGTQLDEFTITIPVTGRCTAGLIDNIGKFILTTEDSDKSYILNLDNLSIEEYLYLPSDFRSTLLKATTISNGNILFAKLGDLDKVCLYDRFKGELIELPFDSSVSVRFMIKHKTPVIDLLTGDMSIYRVY